MQILFLAVIVAVMLSCGLSVSAFASEGGTTPDGSNGSAGEPIGLPENTGTGDSNGNGVLEGAAGQDGSGNALSGAKSGVASGGTVRSIGLGARQNSPNLGDATGAVPSEGQNGAAEDDALQNRGNSERPSAPSSDMQENPSQAGPAGEVADNTEASCKKGWMGAEDMPLTVLENPCSGNTVDTNSQDPEDETVSFAIYNPCARKLEFRRAKRQFIPVSNSERHVYVDFEKTSFEIDAVPWAEVRDFACEVEFFDKIAPMSTANWFACFSCLVSFDAHGNLDMSNVGSVCGMFRDCVSLTSVNMSGWNMLSIRDVGGLFEGCLSLKKVDGLAGVMQALQTKSGVISGLTSLQQLASTRFGISNVNMRNSDSEGGLLGGSGKSLISEETSANIRAGDAKASVIVVDVPKVKPPGKTGASLRSPDMKADDTSPRRRAVVWGSDPFGAAGGGGVDSSLAEGEGAQIGTADQAAESDSIVDGAARSASSLAKSARDACITSLEEGITLEKLISSRSFSDNPYAPFMAGIGIVAAASIMLAFSLKIH